MKKNKCSFAQPRVEYLGHVISGLGVATAEDKIKVVLAWPVPQSVTDVRAFLGLTGYYRRFVKGYGSLAKPLTQLLQKRQFQWTPDAQIAFDKLKQAMVTTPVLALPDFKESFVVETDASDIGIGAVLMQKDRPIAYLSKALGESHRTKSIYEKDFLALIMAVEKWRQYLQRQEFTIRTDHKSLAYLSEQNLHSDLQRKSYDSSYGPAV